MRIDKLPAEIDTQEKLEKYLEDLGRRLAEKHREEFGVYSAASVEELGKHLVSKNGLGRKLIKQYIERQKTP